jgi:AcrR family transcriptional regulator
LFKSKREILSALIAGSSQRMRAPVELPLPKSRAGFLAALESFGKIFLSEFLHKDRMAIYRLAIAEGGKGHPTVAEELDVHGRIPVIQAVARYFEQAAAQGIVPESDRERLIFVFFSVLIGITPLQLLMGTEKSVSAAAIDARAATAVGVLDQLF